MTSQMVVLLITIAVTILNPTTYLLFENSVLSGTKELAGSRDPPYIRMRRVISLGKIFSSLLKRFGGIFFSCLSKLSRIAHCY
jgi:hypothetical protein